MSSFSVSSVSSRSFFSLFRQRFAPGRKSFHRRRPKYKSRPLPSAAILRPAIKHFSIQKSPSVCTWGTRSGLSVFTARSLAQAISSGVSTWFTLID